MPAEVIVLPADFVEKCNAVTAKRPKTVIQHILKHGYITTQELKETYGYNHPPRAVMDVKDNGIPIVMSRVVGSDGRSISAYKFGDPALARCSKLFGRTAFAKDLKERLVNANGSHCAITLQEMDEKLLQIDHRVPYQVDGDGDDADDPASYMLLCGSANRSKSWACEHCENWLKAKDRTICLTCYWASPENYRHVAMEEIRRLDLLWVGKDVTEYDNLKGYAEATGQTLPQAAKSILKKI